LKSRGSSSSIGHPAQVFQHREPLLRRSRPPKRPVVVLIAECAHGERTPIETKSMFLWRVCGGRNHAEIYAAGAGLPCIALRAPRRLLEPVPLQVLEVVIVAPHDVHGAVTESNEPRFRSKRHTPGQ
jgi:hypothetical protein